MSDRSESRPLVVAGQSNDRHDSEPSIGSATALVSERIRLDRIDRVLSARSARLFLVGVVVAYFVLGVIAYGPALDHISNRLFTNISDFSLWIWSMEWTTHALTHGLNPFFSNALFVPTGINLGENTSAPLLALLATPTSLLFGPIVSANLVAVVAMPLSATSALYVLRKWQIWGPAAALGGLAYGFSPYMIGQSTGHPQLTFLPLPPLIALTVTSIVQRRGSSTRLGIKLGLLIAAQFLVSPEILASTLIFAALALIYAAARRIDIFREHARSMVRSISVAALVALVVVAYPVWMMLAGPQHFTSSTIPAVNVYHNDLWSTVVPGPLQQISLGMGSLVRQVEVGGTMDPIPGATETGGYLGIAVLLALIVFAWRGRRSLRMQLSVMLFLAAEVLALGPKLTIGGHVTSVPLPFLLFDHLPLLDNILPVRLTFEAGACAAAVIAFGLDDLRNCPRRRKRPDGGSLTHAGAARSATGAALVLVALVATQLPRWPYQSQVAPVLPTAVRRAVPADNPIAITFPYVMGRIGVSPLVWQAEDGYTFRLLGGYGYHPIERGEASTLPAQMRPPQLQQFLFAAESPFSGPSPPISRQLLVSVRKALDVYHVRLVIVDGAVPGGDKVTSMFTSVLGPPRVSSGLFRLWANWKR